MKSRTLILMWSREGLETIIDATSADKKLMWSALKGEVHIDIFRLNAMILRARTNDQREYEIYAVDVEAHLNDNHIEDMFSENFDNTVALIKEKGKCLFSNIKAENITKEENENV